MRRTPWLPVILLVAALAIALSFRSLIRPESPTATPASPGATSTDDTSPQAPPEEQSQAEVDYASKTWVVLGDSLTEKTYWADENYYDYVVQDLGCSVVNYGVGGTGYMEAGQAEPFYARVDVMDLSNADCLTIFGSFNDLGKGYPPGSASDETTDTIAGCMNATIERLQTANPALAIGIVTPTHWRTGYGFLADGSESYEALTPEDCDAYVALLKEVAARHQLPVLDLYAQFGLEPDDEAVRANYYTTDDLTDNGGVHPNSKGHYLMYPAWREFVRSLLQ